MDIERETIVTRRPSHLLKYVGLSYCTVKKRSKKVWQKAAKDWRKKLWRMLTCIANHQLTVK